MGIQRNGLFGPFSGKVGNLIGSSWKGIDYVKSVPRKTKKEPSAKQLVVRARFALVNQFLLPFKDVLERGYSNQDARRATVLNLAVRENYAALTGTDEHPEPDYSKIVLSKGLHVERPMGCQLVAGAPGHVQVSWSWCSERLNQEYDRASVVISCPERAEVVACMDKFLRRDQLADVEIPSEWLNVTVYGYVFMTGSLGKHSNTAFAGSLVV